MSTDQWFHDLDLIWPTGSIKGIRIDRIDQWEQVGSIPKTGRVTSGSPSALGGDPSRRLYVQLDGSLGPTQSDLISMVPTVHNADSFAVVGADADAFTSWGSLLDPQWAGKVILQRAMRRSAASTCCWRCTHATKCRFRTSAIFRLRKSRP